MVLKRKKYSFSDMLTLALRTSPLYSINYALGALVDALLPTVSIFVTAYFINTAIAVFN